MKLCIYNLACSYVYKLACRPMTLNSVNDMNLPAVPCDYCSSMSLPAVPWANMQLLKLACNYMSLYASSWAWIQFHELSGGSICWSYKSLHAAPWDSMQLHKLACSSTQFHKSEQLTRTSHCLFNYNIYPFAHDFILTPQKSIRLWKGMSLRIVKVMKYFVWLPNKPLWVKWFFKYKTF